LEAGSNIRCFTQRELVLMLMFSHGPDHHQFGVYPKPYRQCDAWGLGKTRIQRPHGLDNSKPGPGGALGIILVGLGINKVDQQPIPEILGNVPIKPLDHLGTGGLVGQYHFAEVFRVKLAGEYRRVHQITEPHRELPAFGFRRTRLHS
jgi:hypothetical protein